MMDDTQIAALVRKLMDYGIEGIRPLSSAEDLAQEYLIDQSYSDDDHRIRSLIRWEVSKNFTTGFLTGLGGLITLPINVPAALGASWVVQARLVGAVARIHGHILRSDRVRTMVLLCLVGDAGKEVLKDFGISLGKRLTAQVLDRVPGRVLIEINKRVGFRLVTKAGEKGLINLARGVPVISGVIGGTLDAAMCRTVGRTAHATFHP
jgi:EcsC protein family